MIGGHEFVPLGVPSAKDGVLCPPNAASLLRLLEGYLAERMQPVCPLPVLVVPLNLFPAVETEEPSPCPVHPACVDQAGSDYCRESWQLHLAELTRQPATHWHRCDHQKLCALVPVVHRMRCLAAVRLVADGATAETEFVRHAEMLDILVRDFVVGHAEFLDRLLHAEQADAILGLAPSAPAHAVGGPLPSHPQVANALRYIDEHLSDPKLSVGSIARALDIHPYYLGQLFAEQIGERMSRFIVSRRIERAKTLLAKGKRQIKRVAHETGFANPNWFCHVFKVYTGLAPGEYRSAAGEQPAGE